MLGYVWRGEGGEMRCCKTIKRGRKFCDGVTGEI